MYCASQRTVCEGFSSSLPYTAIVMYENSLTSVITRLVRLLKFTTRDDVIIFFDDTVHRQIHFLEHFGIKAQLGSTFQYASFTLGAVSAS